MYRSSFEIIIVPEKGTCTVLFYVRREKYMVCYRKNIRMIITMTGYDKILVDLEDRRKIFLECAEKTKIKLKKDFNPIRRHQRKIFIKECKDHADIVGLCIDVIKLNMEREES